MNVYELITYILENETTPTMLQRCLANQEPIVFSKNLRSFQQHLLDTRDLQTLHAGAFYVIEGQIRIRRSALELVRLGEYYREHHNFNSAAACFALAVAHGPGIKMADISTALEFDSMQRADFYKAIEYLEEWAHFHSSAASAITTRLQTIKTSHQAKMRAKCASLSQGDQHRSPAHVLELVDRCQVAAKAISLSHTQEHLDFFLLQLADPIHNRPRIQHGKPRDQRRNLRTNSHHSLHRLSRAPRGNSIVTYREPPTPDSDALIPLKKTAMTLLPPEGRTPFYQHSHCALLLFDIYSCYHKEQRYIFRDNIRSNERPWLVRGAAAPPARGVTLETLQQEYINAHAQGRIRDSHSEQLFAPTKQAVIGVAAREDNWQARLVALWTRNYMREKTGIDVPVFICDGLHPIREYTSAMQNEDLHIDEVGAKAWAAYEADNPVLVQALLQACHTPEDFKEVAKILMLAVANEKFELAQTILNRCGNRLELNYWYLNGDERFTLHLAITQAPPLVAQLLALGANPNRRLSPNHAVALTIALQNDKYDIADLLLAHGALVEIEALAPYVLAKDSAKIWFRTACETQRINILTIFETLLNENKLTLCTDTNLIECLPAPHRVALIRRVFDACRQQQNTLLTNKMIAQYCAYLTNTQISACLQDGVINDMHAARLIVQHSQFPLIVSLKAANFKAQHLDLNHTLSAVDICKFAQGRDLNQAFHAETDGIALVLACAKKATEQNARSAVSKITFLALCRHMIEQTHSLKLLSQLIMLINHPQYRFLTRQRSILHGRNHHGRTRSYRELIMTLRAKVTSELQSNTPQELLSADEVDNLTMLLSARTRCRLFAEPAVNVTEFDLPQHDDGFVLVA